MKKIVAFFVFSLLFFSIANVNNIMAQADKKTGQGDCAEQEINKAMDELQEFIGSNEFDAQLKQLLGDLNDLNISLDENVLSINGEKIDLKETIEPMIKEFSQNLEKCGDQINLSSENLKNISENFEELMQKFSKEMEIQMRELDKTGNKESKVKVL